MKYVPIDTESVLRYLYLKIIYQNNFFWYDFLLKYKKNGSFCRELMTDKVIFK